jgi:trigger factor
MKIDQSNTDLIAKISISIEPSDYLPKYKVELNKVKSKVSLKGFRQGKTPDHVVSKMYGEQVLADVLNKSFQQSLEHHIADNKIVYVCQPMMSEDQEQIELNPSDKERVYSMDYEVGLVDNLDIKGISPEDTYVRYKIETNDEEVATELNALAKQLGGYSNVDSAVEEFDKITVSAVELEDGSAKKDGWQSSFDIYISSIPDEEMKTLFIGKNLKDTVDAPISKLTRMDIDKIRKEWLGVEADDERVIGDEFRYTIETIERHLPAELDDEKISITFGEHGLNTLDELKTRLKENLSAKNEDSTIGKLYQDLHKRINEESTLSFSDSFVKRWLKESEQMEDTKIEEIFEDFKKDLKWTIIQGELQNKYNVKLDYKEVDDFLRQKANDFMGQFGYYDNSIFEKVYNKLIADKKEVYNAQNVILNSKIFSSIIKDITQIEESITLESFNKMLQPEQSETETVG